MCCVHQILISDQHGTVHTVNRTPENRGRTRHVSHGQVNIVLYTVLWPVVVRKRRRFSGFRLRPRRRFSSSRNDLRHYYGTDDDVGADETIRDATLCARLICTVKRILSSSDLWAVDSRKLYKWSVTSLMTRRL